MLSFETKYITMGQSKKSVLIEKVAPKVDLKHMRIMTMLLFFLLCSYYTSDPDISNLYV